MVWKGILSLPDEVGKSRLRLYHHLSMRPADRYSWPIPRWQKISRSPHRTTRTFFGFPTFQWHIHTPINIAGDGATMQPVHDEVAAESAPRSPPSATRAYSDTRSVPARSALDQGRNARSRARSALSDGLALLRGLISLVASSRLPQLSHLVAKTRVGVVANVTFALDVAIWQEALFQLAVHQFLSFFVQAAVLQQFEEEILCDFMMILGGPYV